MPTPSLKVSRKPTRNTTLILLTFCALLVSCATPTPPPPDPYAVPKTSSSNLALLPPKQQLLRARKIHRRAQRALADGQPKRALPLYQQALTVYERLNDPTSQASVHNDLSLIYQQARDLPKASAALQHAITLSQQGNEPIVTLEARYNLARLFVAQRDDTQALPLFNQTIQDASSLNNPELRAMALNGRGNLHRRSGAFDKSLRDHIASIRDWNTLKRVDMVSHAWMNVGYTQTLQGAYKEATNAFQTSANILLQDDADSMPSIERRRRALIPHLNDLIRRLHTDPTNARDHVLSITQPKAP